MTMTMTGPPRVEPATMTPPLDAVLAAMTAFARLSIECPSLLRLAEHLLIAPTREHDHAVYGLAPTQLCDLAFTVSRIGLFADAALVHGLVRACTVKVLGLSAFELAHMAHALSLLGIGDHTLFATIAFESARRIADFSASDLSKLAWAFANLSIPLSVCGPLLHRLADQTCVRIRLFDFQGLMLLFWSLQEWVSFSWSRPCLMRLLSSSNAFRMVAAAAGHRPCTCSRWRLGRLLWWCLPCRVRMAAPRSALLHLTSCRHCVIWRFLRSGNDDNKESAPGRKEAVASAQGERCAPILQRSKTQRTGRFWRGRLANSAFDTRD